MVLNAPYAVYILYKALSFFIDENTKIKINIMSTNTSQILQELVAPNQLEEKFGGTAKNKQIGEFWPPSLPDTNFDVNGQNQNSIKFEEKAFVDEGQLDENDEF